MSQLLNCYVVSRARRGPLPSQAEPKDYPREFLMVKDDILNPVATWTVFAVQCTRFYMALEAAQDCERLVHPDERTDAMVERWEVQPSIVSSVRNVLAEHEADPFAVIIKDIDTRYRVRQSAE